MMKNIMFTNLIPLTISSIFVLYQSIFSIKLEEVKLSSFDNCIIIILNTPYCKECFDQLIKYQDLWSEDYKTILLVKATKSKISVLENKKYYKHKIDFDDLIFIEEQKNDFNMPIHLFEYTIKGSPSIILIKNQKTQLFDHQYLYNGNYLLELKERLNNIFN